MCQDVTMSKSRGEGRSKSEKSQRVFRPLSQTYGDLQKRLRAEEEEWASKCGPVTVRKVEDRT